MIYRYDTKLFLPSRPILRHFLIVTNPLIKHVQLGLTLVGIISLCIRHHDALRFFAVESLTFSYSCHVLTGDFSLIFSLSLRRRKRRF